MKKHSQAHREAALAASSFSQWVLLFSGEGPYVECGKCTRPVPRDKIEEHMLEQHKYDIEDNVVVNVDNKWWRRRGARSQ